MAVTIGVLSRVYFAFYRILQIQKSVLEEVGYFYHTDQNLIMKAKNILSITAGIIYSVGCLAQNSPVETQNPIRIINLLKQDKQE
jgi:hypothetical protein